MFSSKRDSLFRQKGTAFFDEEANSVKNDCPVMTEPFLTEFDSDSFGAGSENRTRTSGSEAQHSTIKLYPHVILLVFLHFS